MNDNTAKHCTKCDRPDSADNLVGCDTYETWMHFGCAGVTDSIADANRSWKCDQCCIEDTMTQSRVSTGRSGSSKCSSRVELSLQMLEEQKALRMKRIMEEEKFLKQKYELLIAEADNAEEESSRNTKLSSRASRVKVQSWLSKHKTGTVQQVAAEPSSSVLPSMVETAHQFSFSKSSLPIAELTMNTTILASVKLEPMTLPSIQTSGPFGGHTGLGGGVPDSITVPPPFVVNQINSVTGGISALRMSTAKPMQESQYPIYSQGLSRVQQVMTNPTSSISVMPAENQVPSWTNRNPICSSIQTQPINNFTGPTNIYPSVSSGVQQYSGNMKLPTGIPSFPTMQPVSQAFHPSVPLRGLGPSDYFSFEPDLNQRPMDFYFIGHSAQFGAQSTVHRSTN
ncbi:uncharacterized protein LOC129779990 [Toxorhynchites rutilus septentrionalis]|uniref:uncharacterized protein LOC129779990 n=1 Tax=Toxorhynchites rutilus septentrionalis TaxID=329112 RepID=UPI00247AEB56|nr:uncharacterized protein LOC129779990 [Toxorhynchites rutilus septentrionalis]